MKSYTKYVWFNTKQRKEIVPMTSEVELAVAESGVKEGFALVSAMHITASVFVNDYERGLWDVHFASQNASDIERIVARC